MPTPAHPGARRECAHSIYRKKGRNDMSQADKESILATLQAFLDERFDIPTESARPEASLRDIGLDSMMVLDVIMEVEDRLGVKLDDVALPRDATLGDVVNLVERNLGVGA
jgi:acyl carrier protein